MRDAQKPDHVRSVRDVTRKDGEAALSWFSDVLKSAQVHG